MGERILGSSGSGRRRRFRWVPLVAIAALALLLAAGAQAVHDTGAFELDGNATTSTSHDWDQVCYQATHDSRCGTTTGAGATAVSWTADILEGTTDPFASNANATIFTGGGSKDPQDINQWAWKDGAGGLPDKDNLVHSFAARYSQAPSTNCPSGTAPTCELLFFGSDRFDNSGDAQQGFWFFQNSIGLGTNSVGGGTGFTGVHRNGDLLIISDFSNGGTTSTISVYRWDNTVSGNLTLLATSNNANCLTAAPHDQFCGLVNAGTITMPWPFLDKSGTTGNKALNGEFYEGGINLSLLGLSGECFASVASETRSSTSTTATLKDFVLGGFGKCGSALTTTPKTGTGDNIPTGGLSIGAGSVTAKDSASLTVTGIPTWTGTLKFFLCGPTALNSDYAPCTSGGTQVGASAGITVTNSTTQPVVSDAATITSAGKYCWRGAFTSGTNGVPDATDATTGECFTVNPVQPAFSTQASGTVQLGNAISDTASLTGTATEPNGNPAGGSITFNVYGPNDATCSGSIVHTATVAVSGNSTTNYHDSFTPTAAGTYRWVASYTGDPPNTLGVSGACNDNNESVVVSPKQPTISTDATADPPIGVPLGTAISDQATLNGTANKPDGSPAGGTITFTLYGPDDLACSGTPAFTSSPIPVSGDGTYNSGTFTPLFTGTYRWVASYSGDSPNTLGVSGQCNDTNEASLIFSLTPSISTSQFFYPNDSATITVASGDGNLAGNVRFRVWTNASCTDPPLYDSGSIDVTSGTGTGLSRTVETSNTTHRVSGDGSVYWRVDYVSTNPAQTNVPGTCGMETATINVTDFP